MISPENYQNQNSVYGKALTAIVYHFMLKLTGTNTCITNRVIYTSIKAHYQLDLNQVEEKNLMERITKTTAAIEKSGLATSTETMSKTKTRIRIYQLKSI